MAVPATDHRDAVQAVEAGDLVDVATEQYDYTNPMQVAAVHDREVWETPAGPDILVASLEIDGARTTYSAEYNGGQGRFVLESASVTHEITEFTLVDESEDDSEEEGEDVQEDTDDETEADDGEESSVSWTESTSEDSSENTEADASADGGTQTKYSTGSVDLDPSEHAPDDDEDDADASEEWDMSFDVPDGITKQQVRSAVKGSLSLQGVLESLEWPEGDRRARERIRALVFDLGLYDDLVEAESWDRRQAEKRGWQ